MLISRQKLISLLLREKINNKDDFPVTQYSIPFFGLQTKFTLLKQQITIIIVICCFNIVNLVWRPRNSIEYCVTGKSSFFSHKPHLVCVCFFLSSFFSAPSRLCWHFKKLIQHLLTCKHGTFFVFIRSILDIQRWYGLFKIMFKTF